MLDVPSWLTVSKSFIIQRLIADVPFIAAGVVSFAVSLLLVMKRRINVMTSMIMLSSFFSFVAALVDLVILVCLSNRPRGSAVTPSAFGNVTARVVREMLLACAITLRFLFFWHIVGLPSRGEVQTPVTMYPPGGSFIPSQRDMHSGNWLQWGIFGVVLKYFLLMAVVAVGVLETIWRLEIIFLFNLNAAPIEAASATLEIALSVLFALKLLGNLLFTLVRRLKMLLGFLPVLVAMAVSTGVGAGNLAVGGFMETPLGRLLQALELYILSQYVLFVAFDDVGPPGEPSISPQIEEEQSLQSRRVSAAESFSAVQVLSDDLAVAPVRRSESVSRSPTRNISRSNRPISISTERITSWVSRRLSGRPSDALSLPYSGRSSTPKEDYAGGTSASTSSGLRSNGGETVWTKADSIYAMYATDNVQGLINKPIRAPRRSGDFIVPAAAPPVPKLNLKGYQDPPPESPIYGLNGPICPRRTAPGAFKIPSPTELTTTRTPQTAGAGSSKVERSLNTEALLRTKEESSTTESAAKIAKAINEFSAEGIQTLDLSVRASGSVLFSDVGSPQSSDSQFSLDRFPLPPALASGKSEDETQTLKPNRDSGAESDIDAAFELVMPGPSGSRLQSFASTTRDSEIDLAMPSGVRASSNDPYPYLGREITSFIGGEMNNDGDEKMAGARVISRILTGQVTRPQTKLPVDVAGDDKSRRLKPSGLSKAKIPLAGPETAFPANTRPALRSRTPTDTRPGIRFAPTQPRAQRLPDVRGRFETPRPAPAPSSRGT